MIKKAIYNFIGRKIKKELNIYIQTISSEIRMHYGFEDPKVDECSAKIIRAIVEEMKSV